MLGHSPPDRVLPHDGGVVDELEAESGSVRGGTSG